MDQKKFGKFAGILVWVIALCVWGAWKGDFFPPHQATSGSITHEVRRTPIHDHSVSSQGGPSDKGAGGLDLRQVDSYVLALSWQPGFCSHEGERPECRNADQKPLTLHGFWPSVPNSLKTQGIGSSEWNREGCFLVNDTRDGAFCSFAEPRLDRSLKAELDKAMPATQSCLERHEFVKHGACFNITAQDYFSRAVHLYNAIAQSQFAQWLSDHRGRQVARNDIISTFSATFHTNGRALMLMCDRSNRLTDLRMGIRADQADRFPAPDSFVSAGTGRCGQQVML